MAENWAPPLPSAQVTNDLISKGPRTVNIVVSAGWASSGKLSHSCRGEAHNACSTSDSRLPGARRLVTRSS